MDLKTIIVTVLSLTAVNNYIASKALGIPNALVKDQKKIDRLGTISSCAIIVSGFLGLTVSNFLNGTSLSYLTMPVSALICAAVSYGAAKLFKADKIETLLTVFNSAMIGCVYTLSAQGLDYSQIVYPIAAGVSYWIGMYLYAGAVSRIDESAVPANFRGLPIEMLALGIVALAVLAFK